MIEAEFRRPELRDQELISWYFRQYPSRSCDRTFANVFLWAKHYNVEFAEYKRTLLFRDNSAGYGFSFPAGVDEDVRNVIPELVNQAKEDGERFCLYGITKEHMEKLEMWFPKEFVCEYNRDEADYVYETEKLATLSGKKLHSKRNHINKFRQVHAGNWSYETLSGKNLEECFQMALRWRNENGCEEDEEKNAEMCVTLNSLRLFEELGLTGGVLSVDGEIVAFTIGEAVNDDTFVVHIEKAYAEVEGSYTMINQQFVEHELLGKYRYVNREDDVGLEGLRKAKLSYKPVFLVEKGYVTLANEQNTERHE